MCIAFLIIAKYCDTCIQSEARRPDVKWHLYISCVDLNSLRNIRYPAEWTGRFQNENKNK